VKTWKNTHDGKINLSLITFFNFIEIGIFQLLVNIVESKDGIFI